MSLGMVVGVEADVLGREVGGPEADRGAALAKGQLDVRIAAGADRAGDGRRIELDRRGVAIQQESVECSTTPAGSKGTPA